MEYEIKKEIEITLKLTQEELNTIACALGKTSLVYIKPLANEENLKLVNDDESVNLYHKLMKVAKEV